MDSGYWILDAGFLILDAGCGLRGAGGWAEGKTHGAWCERNECVADFGYWMKDGSSEACRAVCFCILVTVYCSLTPETSIHTSDFSPLPRNPHHLSFCSGSLDCKRRSLHVYLTYRSVQYDRLPEPPVNCQCFLW